MTDMLGIPKNALNVATAVSKEILLILKKSGQDKLAKLSVDLEYVFKTFLERNFRQFSRIKTLLNSATPVALESVFVSPNLTINNQFLTEDEFLSLLERENFAVITGSGGSGKSVFLKHIFIRYYNEARGRIPFLIELRNIPQGMSLKDYALKLLQVIEPKLEEWLFDYSLRSGKFVFLLDGFDEVDHSLRDDLAKQIQDITYAFGENLVLVSSRPDQTFLGWSEFSVAEMVGFTKPQVISLIKKVRYDKQVTKEFLKLIADHRLYETHGSYLSNPLLCSIMLLTFEEGSEIPTKMHLFFGQTFDVLFYRHDATKGTAFRRKFHTSLSIDDFRAVLSAFSSFTYVESGPSIQSSNAIAAADNALKYCRLQQAPSDFLQDLCSSVSLLIKEGDTYSYIHRSFQEYFFALFLSSCDVKNWGDLVEEQAILKPNDSVVKLLADINRDRFEQEFLAPRLQELKADLDKIDVARNPSKAFLLFYLDISVRTTDGSLGIYTWTVGQGSIHPKWHYFTRFLNDPQVLLDGFDWQSHVLQHNKSNGDVRGEASLGKIDDAVFLNTPMVAYLQKIKENVFSMHTELEKNVNTQQRLLSDNLFKRS